MKRPKSKLIVERSKVEENGHWRDRFVLECNHVVIRAMRKGGRPSRIICPRCDP